MHWYTDVLKKYAVFDGRSGRPEFWWFTLISIIISTVIYFICRAIFGTSGQFVSGLYSLAVLLPSIGVAIRRLHDTDRSGWWILLYFLIFIGWIVLIVFWAIPSDPTTNKYGEPETA